MKKCLFFNLLWVLLFVYTSDGWAQKKSKKEFLVTISTEFGDMHLILYDQTPKHKENFLKLAQEGFYNDLLFHRIIAQFMIQGGDPDSKKAEPGKPLGRGENGYTIPAEFNPTLIHCKGALAAARNNNPQKASSGCQFYIVQGKTIPGDQLKQMSGQGDAKYTDEQIKIYEKEGGTPQLDQNYTVFGQVIQGLEVLDKIAAQPKDNYDRPVKDIKMKITVENLKKKKITKKYGYQFV